MLMMSDKEYCCIDLLRLLVCIATSSRGWTDEQHKFMRKLEKELFDDE